MGNNIQIIKYNLIEQFNNIDVNQNLIIKKEEYLKANTKKLTMENFGLKKGNLKFLLTLLLIEKLLFQ